MVGGGPSVLCDAVAVLASKEGAALLANDSAAKDFVSDAFAHCKFIAYVSEVMPLFEKAGLANASMTVASRSSRTGMRKPLSIGAGTFASGSASQDENALTSHPRSDVALSIFELSLLS